MRLITNNIEKDIQLSFLGFTVVIITVSSFAMVLILLGDLV